MPPPRFPSTPCHGRTAAALLLCAIAPLPALAARVEIEVRDAGGAALPEAVVYVLLRGQPETAPKGTVGEIAQRGKQFLPQVNVFQTGTAVSFPNFDTVRHHVYSFSPIRPFEIKLYVGTPAAPVVFDRAGTAVLGCNIHDRMAAWVHIVDTPLFARTDAAGRAGFELPAGEHELRAWHAGLPEPGTPLRQPLRVDGADSRLQLALPVKAAP